MAASKQDISSWFDEGVSKAQTHTVVVCDTFDWDDYPVFVGPLEDVHDVKKRYSGNIQKVMEVYNLSLDKQMQMNEFRAFRY